MKHPQSIKNILVSTFGAMSRETDWISAVCSLVAAIVAVVTLLTVYLAAMQILSRRQVYRLGVSTKSLGPWKSKVVTPSLLRMQTQISTPTISLPNLVKKNWQPNVTFPTGLSPKTAVPDPECGPVLAEASWVNFLEGLGLEPIKSAALYEMQSESEMVNGIVPMRWKGRDLVGICSILGFQVPENKPDLKRPMPLPTQWSGPLGWLQFRTSSDGCIVEYRRRAVLKNQLPADIHGYYQSLKISHRPLCLVSRLWQSISGLHLPDKNKVLYIGGTNPWGKNTRDREDDVQRSTDEICDEVMKFDPTEEEIRRMLFGKKSKRPDAAQKGLSQMSQSPSASLPGLPEFLRGLGGGDFLKSSGTGKSGKMEVLNPCPGLLSVIVQGELADSRGLDFYNCHEYYTQYTDPEEVNKTTHPYKLGHLCMDLVLLELMKEAVLNLKPDGFYFSPTVNLYHNVSGIWSHVEDQTYKFKHIFQPVELENWRSDPSWANNVESPNSQLYYAMVLCNEFQRIKTTSRAMFTIDDMRMISKASESLRRIVSPQGMDLIWAIIASPELFSDLVQRFGQDSFKVQSVLDSSVKCQNGIVNCTSLSDAELDPGLDGRYSVPLMGEGDFPGIRILAAFLDVFLTFFWMESKWISDVAMCDTTMPQSVTMC